jgi:ribosomal protein L29
MVLPKYIQLSEIKTISQIDLEISLLTKNLFDLRIKKATNQRFKCHLFTHIKRKIAQLNFKKKVLLKLES